MHLPPRWLDACVEENISVRTLRHTNARLLLVSGMVAIGPVGVAQQSPTEAPTGFDAPTLAQNPGSQSVSNGIAQPAGDTGIEAKRVQARITTR